MTVGFQMLPISQELQTEKQNLMKTMELQDIRLQSITKILKTQEDTINASTKAFSSPSKVLVLICLLIIAYRCCVIHVLLNLMQWTGPVGHQEMAGKSAGNDGFD